MAQPGYGKPFVALWWRNPPGRSSSQFIGAPNKHLSDALTDRYRIERELGEGGMAIVYLARDHKHNRLVALNVLREEVGAALGRDRFLREVEVTAGLQHPHILPVFDSGETAGHLWYTMPYVEGETLRSRLTRVGRLPLSQVLQIARDVGAALA